MVLPAVGLCLTPVETLRVVYEVHRSQVYSLSTSNRQDEQQRDNPTDLFLPCFPLEDFHTYGDMQTFICVFYLVAIVHISSADVLLCNHIYYVERKMYSCTTRTCYRESLSEGTILGNVTSEV